MISHFTQITAEGSVCTKCAYAILAYRNLSDTVAKKFPKTVTKPVVKLPSPAAAEQPAKKRSKFEEFSVNEKVLYYDKAETQMLEATVMKMVGPGVCQIVNQKEEVIYINKKYLTKTG